MNLINEKPEGMTWQQVGTFLEIDRSYAFNIAKFPHKYSLSKVLRLGKIFGLSEEKIKKIWADNKIAAQNEIIQKIKETAK